MNERTAQTPVPRRTRVAAARNANKQRLLLDMDDEEEELGQNKGRKMSLCLV